MPLPCSQAPAWKHTSAKLRFAVADNPLSLASPKQSAAPRVRRRLFPNYSRQGTCGRGDADQTLLSTAGGHAGPALSSSISMPRQSQLRLSPRNCASRCGRLTRSAIGRRITSQSYRSANLNFSERRRREPGCGPTAGLSRVLRGGYFGHSASLCRSSYRSFNGPTYRDHLTGFRVAAGQEGR
jgi:hypothetical protein